MKLRRTLDIVEDTTLVLMIVGFIAQMYGFILHIVGMDDKTTKSIGLAGHIVIMLALLVNLLVGWALSAHGGGGKET